MVGTEGRHPLNVMVATPLGEGGRGGIDRIMDEVGRNLTAHPRTDIAVASGATRGQGHILTSPLFLVAFLARLAARRLLRRVDVLHVNLSSHGSTRRKIIICKAARRLGVPYVIHLHGSRFRQFWDGAPPRLSRAIHDMFADAASIIVLGSVWRDYVLAHVPDAADRIVIVPNATPAPLAGRTPRVPDAPVTILFLGRVGPRKGTSDLIMALGHLADDPTWTAIVAGDGDLDTARAELVRAGIDRRVEVTGWVGPDQVSALLSAADILVLPSYDENLPMSVIEAMAHGLAVITTPVGAVEDIIQPDVTGLLVAPGDVGGLEAALRRLLNDGALRRRLGGAAQHFHRAHLDIGPYVDRLAAVWHAAARARR